MPSEARARSTFTPRLGFRGPIVGTAGPVFCVAIATASLTACVVSSEGEDSSTEALETASIDYEAMSLAERLDHYVDRIPTIYSDGTPEVDRRAFFSWRRKDLASLTPEERKAHLGRERESRKAYRAAKEKEAWELRCGDRDVTLFDPDPEHPYNRVYRALYVRADKSGCNKGWDAIDPYLYANTSAYLEGEAFTARLAEVRKFSEDEALGSIRDPLRRALMQRNLLQVFHWAVERAESGAPVATAARTLSDALVPAIAGLALPEKEIRALPDNLALAIRSGAFETKDITKASSDKPYLPAGLADARSNFVVFSTQDGPAARVHAQDFRHGAAFIVSIALPGSFATTKAYVDSLASFTRRQVTTWGGETYRNPRTPQFPAGTQVALVRKAMLWAREGRPVVSPLTESVQGRVYSYVGIVDSNPDNTQHAYLLHLSQAALLAGRHGGLEDQRHERDHSRFLTGFDPFEQGGSEDPALGSCLRCHAQQDLSGHKDSAGIHSVISYSRLVSLDRKHVPADPVFLGSTEELARITAVASARTSWKKLVSSMTASKTAR